MCERINKNYVIYMSDIYIWWNSNDALKTANKKDVLSYATTWMNLRTLLNELNQSQKTKDVGI